MGNALKTSFVALCAIGLCSAQASSTAKSAYTAQRLNEWQVVGPGGGGAQFNPTLSSVDPNLVLVSCDMTGSYISADGGNSWRMFNLRGVVRFFVADPIDGNIIYAATRGLYRSNDKGKTWALIYPRPGDVMRVVVSGDHAEEQFVLRSGIDTLINALAIDPTDSSSLFAVISKNKGSALYRSTDSGKTWQLIRDVLDVGKIYIDPASPQSDRTIYLAGTNSVSVLEHGVFREQKAPAGVNRFLDIAAGFPGSGKKPTFYAVSGIDWRAGDTGVTGLFVSADGGAAWQSISINFLSDGRKDTPKLELRAVGTSLNYPQAAYLSFRDHTPELAPDKKAMGVAKTLDQGKTWQVVWRDTEVTAAQNMQDPWINKRFGPGWAENPFALAVSPVDPNICFGTDFGRTVRTQDGGNTWRGMYAHRLNEGGSTTTGLDVLTTHGIHFDPFDQSHWFVDFTDIGLFESRNDGRSWSEASSRGIPREWENTAYWVAFDPDVKGRLWAVVSGTHDLPRPKMWRRSGVKDYLGGAVISEDGGLSWKPSGEGMPQTAATHILLDPKSSAAARTLYVCGFGKGVYKSTDSGRHWLLKNSGLEGNEPFAWRMVQDSKGRLYLLVARRSEDGRLGTEGDGALYRSVDGAEHWKKVALPSGCNGPNGLAIDPTDPRRLYLAAWGRSAPTGDNGGGIFLSSDAGNTWKSVLGKDQHIFDVTLDLHKPSVLYAAGFESSVWKSIDRGEHWARIEGYNFKWGQRVFPDPNDPAMIYVCTYGGSIWHGPASSDHGAYEDIVTPIVKLSR